MILTKEQLNYCKELKTKTKQKRNWYILKWISTNLFLIQMKLSIKFAYNKIIMADIIYKKGLTILNPIIK